MREITNFGYIYLLECNNTYKIGATKSKDQINKRIKQLSTGNPSKITLINSFQCEKYYKVEKSLHKKYKQHKTETNNEWFNLSEEQVQSFITDCEVLCENLTYVYNNNFYLNELKTNNRRI